ncbi:MAG: ral secretion pathway protein GspN [Pseudomonadota bacterium]|jgi:general secretion pathway protein N
MKRFLRLRRGAPALHSTHWAESTLAEESWDRSRGASKRWAWAGALLGLLLGLVIFAPATWLANGVAQATGGRLLLADARGTVWSGSAQVVLTGGEGSRDAAALPGRMQWTLGIAHRGAALGLSLNASQACCLNGAVQLQAWPGWGRIQLALQAPGGAVGQWPSAWLGGLGAPWNTLQLGGSLRLQSSGLVLESVQGRWRVEGGLDLELLGVSSRVSTLEPLGSYRLSLRGDPAQAGAAQLELLTLQGALQLQGSGVWGAGGVRFRGDAHAAPGAEAALANLLNIIGRRDGARSVISIG